MVINTVKIFAIIFFCIIFIAWIDPSYDQTEEGNQLYSQGKYDEAISKYVDVQMDSPESPVIDFNIANAQYKTEKYDEAIAAYEKVISNSRDIELEAKANFNVGNSLYRKGKLREALDMYKRTIELTDELVDLDSKGKEVDKLREDAKFNHEFVEKKIKEMLSKQKERQEQEKEEEQKQDKEQEQLQDQGQDQKDQNQGEEEQQQEQQQEQQEQSAERDKEGGKGNEEEQDQSKNENKEEKDKSPQEDKLSENKDEIENRQEPQAMDAQDKPHKQPEVNMTEEEASRLLEALQQNEKNNKINLQLEYTKGSFIDKDW